MQTKTIVVHLENAALCPARLATAVDMASRHGAHLTGLFMSIEEFDGDVYGRSRGRGLRGARQDRLAQESAQAQADFEAACSAAGLASYSQAVKAIEREDEEKLALWRKALAAK